MDHFGIGDFPGDFLGLFVHLAADDGSGHTAHRGPDDGPGGRIPGGFANNCPGSRPGTCSDGSSPLCARGLAP